MEELSSDEAYSTISDHRWDREQAGGAMDNRQGSGGVGGVGKLGIGEVWWICHCQSGIPSQIF
jgi:hypothetical protein